MILDNILGKFTRTDPIIVNESGALDSIHGLVQQLEVFDMDADGKSDIVILDDSGELSILYGTVRTIAGKEEHIFVKKLIESGLGIRLSTAVRNDGGAFSYTGLTSNLGTTGINTSASSSTVNQGLIDNLIYYIYNYRSVSATQNSQITPAIAGMISIASSLAGSGNFDTTALSTTVNAGSNRTFIRSPFAEGKGLKVEKSYKIITSQARDTMQMGDKIRVEIVLTNTTNKAFRDAVYLDSNDRKLFFPEQSGIYTTVSNSGTEQQHPLKYLTAGEFDYGFDFVTIAPGEVIRIQYLVTATPTAFGKMTVGLLEKGEAGDDIYGDIGLSPNNICGGTMIMWRSIQLYPRSYKKGTKLFVDNSILPDSLAQNAIDLNKNRIPDYIDALIASGKGDPTVLKNYANTQFNQYRTNAIANSIPKNSQVVSYNASNHSIEIGGLNSGNIEAINGQIDEVVK